MDPTNSKKKTVAQTLTKKKIERIEFYLGYVFAWVEVDKHVPSNARPAHRERLLTETKNLQMVLRS